MENVQSTATAPAASATSYAGFLQRFLAWLIDWVILGVVQFVILVPILGAIGIGASSMETMTEENATALMGAMMGASLVMNVVFMAIGWLYFALMESGSKQGTLGKMALGIKVTDTNGARISFGKASLRFIGKIISGMILLIGYIMAAFTEKKQALHDMIAGTLVMK